MVALTRSRRRWTLRSRSRIGRITSVGHRKVDVLDGRSSRLGMNGLLGTLFVMRKRRKVGTNVLSLKPLFRKAKLKALVVRHLMRRLDLQMSVTLYRIVVHGQVRKTHRSWFVLLISRRL